MRFSSQTPLLVLALLTPFTFAKGDALKDAVPEKLSDVVATKENAPVIETAPVDDKYTTFNAQRVPPLKDLTGDNFDENTKNGYTAVKFYSPMCHHCQTVAPIWQTLYEFYWTSKPLATSGTTTTENESLNDFHHYYSFDFANVDCIAFGDTCAKYDVKAFPTFILFKDGVATDKKFTGARGIDELSSWIEEALEVSRPGSRGTKGGLKLPKVGADSVEGFKAPPPPAPKSEAKDGFKDKIPGTGLITKPTKPSRVANPYGTSVPLSAESFQDLVTMSQEPWFIKFYAPWCGHCQAMAPLWIQLAKEQKGRLNIGEVNCDVETRLCKDVRLRGYPTILFFRGGERVEYTGLRGLGDFINYTNKAISLGSGVQDVSASEFKILEETEEVIFVYFYDHATTSEDFAALERLTLSLIGHATLVKTNSNVLAERFKITTWPRLLVSRDGRPTYYTALAPSDMRDFRQVLSWMESVWLPIVPELTASNSREIMNGKLVVLGILTRKRSDEFLIAKKEIKSAAHEWMDKQTQLFQLERQELRDAKQLRIEEAEDRNDQRALRSAKGIRISMDRSDRKEVGFAWVDGVFWERWVRTTYGIEVKDGEKVVINDEDNRRYWDLTSTSNPIVPSRTSILETLSQVVKNPPKMRPKLTISAFEKVLFDVQSAFSSHPVLCIGGIIAALGALVLWLSRRRGGRRRGGYGGGRGDSGYGQGGGFFRLGDETSEKRGGGLGLLGGGGGVGGKVD